MSTVPNVMPDLAGDCAIASSFVSYLGPFNKEFRELLLGRDFAAGCKRLSIPCTRDLHVSQFLADDSEIGEWTLQVSKPSLAGHPEGHAWRVWCQWRLLSGLLCKSEVL